MDFSVLIPTHARPAKLAACVERLARQKVHGQAFEVLVGLDGADESSERAAMDAWRAAGPGAGRTIRVLTLQRGGHMECWNSLMREATGTLLVSLNDDVLPCEEFLAQHAAGHRDAGRTAVVVGASPFLRSPGESLLNRLVAETSMIFFYDRMDAASEDRSRDWGFRHVFGLNFSVPLAAVRGLDGYFSCHMLNGYDDIELGYRLQRRWNAPVLYRPDALARHDHAYLPAGILERERQLGIAAWTIAELKPEFAEAVFGRNIRSEEEVGYSIEFVRREKSAADRLRRSFLRLGDIPGGVLDGPSSAELLNLIYEQHLLLKRWTWRTGLLQAAGVLSPQLASA